MLVVLDMTNPTAFKSFTLFTYSKYMTHFKISKYSGSKQSPSPADSGWEQVAQGDVNSDQSYQARYQQPQVAEVSPFTSQYLLVRVKSNDSYQILAGIKAFSL